MKRCLPLIVSVVFLWACSDPQMSLEKDRELKNLRSELDSLKASHEKGVEGTFDQITTFLTFQENNAEEAMNFYVQLFEHSQILDVQRYGEEGPGKAGTIFMARFELNGSAFACSDSYIKHEWTFSPAVSNWIDCGSIEEIEYLYQELSEGGQVMMPMDNYGFSSKFAFVEDRFGVHWQLNLAE